MTVMKIFKTENIIKVSPEDTLSQAFSLLSSSHDSAFVIEGKDFLGVVNPHYSLIKKSYPFNTKVKNCMIHPPMIDINYSLKKVAHLMMDSKIHYLPVFCENKFYAIITARRILTYIKDTPELDVKVSDYLKRKKPLVSVYEDDQLVKAISLFKKYHISKLIVISKDFKLKGIMAYFDIISHLISPQEKTNYGGNEKYRASLMKRYVKNFMKTQVITLSPEDKMSKAAELILEKQIGSVIIIDREKHPIGIVTTKDLLSLYVGNRTFPKIELVANSLSRNSLILAKAFTRQIGNQLGKIRDVSKAKFIIKEKQGSGVFKTMLSIFKKDNSIKVIKEEGKNLDQVLQDVKGKVRNSPLRLKKQDIIK